MEKYELQKLRDLPIEGVAERLGLRVVRHKALCPFHDDHHASLSFSVRRNSYRCFVCGAHGGPIDLVMKYLNKPFLDACRWLADGSWLTVNGSGFNKPQPSDISPQTSFDASRYERFFERPWLSDEARRFLFDERRLDPRVVRWCRLTSWKDKQGVPWLQTPYYDREGKLIGLQNRNLTYGSGFTVQGSPSSSAANHEPLTMNRGSGFTVQGSPSSSAANHEPLTMNRGSGFTVQSSRSSSAANHEPLTMNRGSGFTVQSSRSSSAANHEPLTMNREPRFRFPQGAECCIYNLPVLNLLKPGEPLYITEGCSDCWAMLSAGHKAIAIPSATLLKRKDAEQLETLNLELGTTFHMYPDRDEPGERLFLQLKEVLPNLEHHQLPPGCKDFSDYYLTTRDKPPDFRAKLPAFHSKRPGFRAKLGDLEYPGNF